MPTLPAGTDLVATETDYFYPVLFHSDCGRGPVRVDIEPGTWLEGLLGTGYAGVGNGTGMDVEMVVFR